MKRHTVVPTFFGTYLTTVYYFFIWSFMFFLPDHIVICLCSQMSISRYSKIFIYMFCHAIFPMISPISHMFCHAYRYSDWNFLVFHCISGTSSMIMSYAEFSYPIICSCWRNFVGYRISSCVLLRVCQLPRTWRTR